MSSPAKAKAICRKYKKALADLHEHGTVVRSVRQKPTRLPQQIVGGFAVTDEALADVKFLPEEEGVSSGVPYVVDPELEAIWLAEAEVDKPRRATVVIDANGKFSLVPDVEEC